MALLPPVVIELQATISQLQAKLGEAKGELDSMQAHGESFGSAFASAGVTAFAAVGAAAVGVGVAAVELADKFEVSHARLTAALTANGQSFGEWSSKISAADDAGQKLGFTNQQVEDGLARLEVMVQNPAVALRDLAVAEDVARARGLDLTTASQLVGKAQEGIYTAMVRLGIVTADQAKAFRSGGEAVDFLASRFGGQASAYADTFAGKLQTLKATSENLGKDIGLILIPIVEGFASALAGSIHWVEEHGAAIKQTGEIIAAILVPAFGLWALAQANVIAAGLVTFVENVANAAATLAVTVSDAATALFVMGTAVDSALGPIGAMAAAFVAISSIGKNMWNDITDAQKEWLTSLEAGIPAGTDKLAALTKVNTDLWQEIDKVKNSSNFNGVAYNDLTAKAKLLGDAIVNLTRQHGAQTQAAKDLAGAIGQDSSATDTSSAADETAKQKKADLTQAVKDSDQAIKDVTASTKAYYGEVLTADQADIAFHQHTDELTAAIKASSGSLDVNTQAGRNALTAVDNLINGQITLIEKEYASGDSAAVMTQKISGPGGYVSALDAALRSAGLTTGQVDALNVKWGLTPPAVSTQILVNTDVAQQHLDALVAQTNNLRGIVNADLIRFGRPQAAGGPVEAGTVYPVGEQGMELFMPLVPGNVISNADTMALLNKGADTGAGSDTAAGVSADALAMLAALQKAIAAATGIVARAETWYGVPYRWGGGHGGVSEAVARFTGVDCSGLVDQIWGKDLGNAWTQAAMGTAVPSLAQAIPGDLVFFGAMPTPHHVGIYKGGGIMINALHTGTVVRDDPLLSDFSGIRRLVGPAGSGGPLAAVGVTGGSIIGLAQEMAAARGWTGGEWNALYQLGVMESGWNNLARNPSSGAYGIAQAINENLYPPAGRSTGGSDPGTQIQWMLNYIAGRYGDPIGALNHEFAVHWYDTGGIMPPGLSLSYNNLGRPEYVSPDPPTTIQAGAVQIAISLGGDAGMNPASLADTLVRKVEAEVLPRLVRTLRARKG